MSASDVPLFDATSADSPSLLTSADSAPICLLCRSNVLEKNSAGSPLLCCVSCTPFDHVRPPLPIPLSMHSSTDSSLVSAVRVITYPLRKGSWNPSPLWNYFLSRATKVRYKSASSSSNSDKLNIVSSDLLSLGASSLQLYLFLMEPPLLRTVLILFTNLNCCILLKNLYTFQVILPIIGLIHLYALRKF
ncbi:hypothetical protein GEMRC1_012620 [Eukaryota sp. GEM-RC1]